MKRVSLRLHHAEGASALMRLVALALGHTARRPERTAMAAVASLGLIGIATTGATIWSTQRALELVQQRAMSIMASAHAAPPIKQQGAPSPAQRKAINAMVRQLNAPWPDIFDLIEAHVTPTVALLAIEPRTEGQPRRSVRVLVEARQLDDLLSYVDRLRADPAIAQVVLAKHETNEQDPNKPVRLSFDATLTEPALPPSRTAR